MVRPAVTLPEHMAGLTILPTYRGHISALPRRVLFSRLISAASVKVCSYDITVSASLPRPHRPLRTLIHGECAVPILSEALQTERSRTVLALRAAVAIFSLLLGSAVAWSWFQPVILMAGNRGIFFGRWPGNYQGSLSLPPAKFDWGEGDIQWKLPSKSGREAYWIGWKWVE